MACCGAKGHPRKSRTGLRHFYHGENDGGCGGEPESLEHLKLKYQVYHVCRSEGWPAQPEYQSPAGDWRADVFTQRDGRKITFEVQLSTIGLADLKEREEKYRRDGIESYWILKDFMNFFPHDNPDVVTGSKRGVPVNTYLSEAEFSLDREQELLIRHGIRTIGITPDCHCLYTAENTGIAIPVWVKSVLTGGYQKSLDDFETRYTTMLRLRELARPELKKLLEISYKKAEYEEQMKKIYTIFKNNRWDEYHSLQEGISGMYETFRKFDAARRRVMSSKNGFVWKDSLHPGRVQPPITISSENQINSIHHQLLDAEEEEKNFLAVYQCIRQQIEQKNPEKARNTRTRRVEFGRSIKWMH